MKVQQIQKQQIRNQAVQNNRVNFKGQKEFNDILTISEAVVNQNGTFKNLKEAITLFFEKNGFTSKTILSHCADGIHNNLERIGIFKNEKYVGMLDFDSPFISYSDREIAKTISVNFKNDCEKKMKIVYPDSPPTF